jgi:cation diffusion facilitator CzcD-associated flavoprotein CzcO
MSERRVVVIGAGPAGLAAAVEFGRRGVPAIVLERGEAVGWSWRGRYDRLRLNSSRWFSSLPGARHKRGTPMFPSRDELVRYLEDYAKRGSVDVRVNTQVERIDRDGSGWIVRTSAGDLAADQVIVATGYDHTPAIPDWPGRDSFAGRLIHSAEYRNAEPFRSGDVLVVGSGSSGMEIAHDIRRGGAARVRVAVRTPPNILVRSPIGPGLARAMMKLPPRVADRIMVKVRQKEIGDLAPYGLPAPEEGVFGRLRRLGVAPAIIDHEVLEAIRDREIEIVAAIEAFDERGVRLADGSRVEPDAVVAATGYRSGLEPLVGHLGVLDERGVPRTDRDEAAPGLRFIGYRPRPAHIGYMGRDARWAARAIARRWPGAAARPATIGAPAAAEAG